jgi:hypothetical protein
VIQSPNLQTFKEPRNRFQGINSARLGIDLSGLLKRFTNSGSDSKHTVLYCKVYNGPGRENRGKRQFSRLHNTTLVFFSLLVLHTVYKSILNTLQRKNAENLKQIFPEKEYRSLSPNFYIHVSVSEIYISTMGLPFLLEEICGLIWGIYKSLTDT